MPVRYYNSNNSDPIAAVLSTCLCPQLPFRGSHCRCHEPRSYPYSHRSPRIPPFSSLHNARVHIFVNTRLCGLYHRSGCLIVLLCMPSRRSQTRTYPAVASCSPTLPTDDLRCWPLISVRTSKPAPHRPVHHHTLSPAFHSYFISSTAHPASFEFLSHPSHNLSARSIDRRGIATRAALRGAARHACATLINCRCPAYRPALASSVISALISRLQISATAPGCRTPRLSFSSHPSPIPLPSATQRQRSPLSCKSFEV